MTAAARVAGVLAKSGITHLVLETPGTSPIDLFARRTDLPGVLLNAGVGSVLSTPDRSTVIELTIDGPRVVAATDVMLPALADACRDADYRTTSYGPS